MSRAGGMATPRSMSSTAEYCEMSGSTVLMKLRKLESFSTVARTASALAGLLRPKSITTWLPIPGAVASPSCCTPQCPSRITKVSTTAIGQERNVLEKIATAVMSTDISHRMIMLLARLMAKGWVAVTSTKERCWSPR